MFESAAGPGAGFVAGVVEVAFEAASEAGAALLLLACVSALCFGLLLHETIARTHNRMIGTILRGIVISFALFGARLLYLALAAKPRLTSTLTSTRRLADRPLVSSFEAAGSVTPIAPGARTCLTGIFAC